MKFEKDFELIDIIKSKFIIGIYLIMINYNNIKN